MYVRIKKREIKEGKFQKMIQYKKIMKEITGKNLLRNLNRIQ
jgi:hypothetical protein